ncbi:transglutaminase domain-containing protein [Rufibacter glacialis]|uniref:DUF3857 domain-containing protein n=1 Tax=Rufibacter glacialis TaxID=1259555 RepID=A0A5M8QEQ8_9BACT|nr:DUF3857 and transglutaminase domain-containing protein [Rufibacter glacialis]KAA6433454.1 DUF3857 domain-containing protein [Rufibacter glacialis]GGK74072.1 hypothetical protein GCM10011405_22660 [Rufibacter glacialis]
MKTKKLLTPWLALLWLVVGMATPSYADDPFKLGQPTPEELKMTTYAPDTSAAAVVLYDLGESSFLFTKGTQVQFRRIVRIKILKKNGLDQADFLVPYYRQADGKKEEVLNVKGFTYNWENGQMVKMKLDEKAIFDEKQNANWYLKKLTMPGVKVGSVIELTYTIKSDFIKLLREWEFQQTIPVKWSEYRVGMVPFFEYSQVKYGVHPFHIKDAKIERKTVAVTWQDDVGITKIDQRGSLSMSVVQYQWAMKDVPAFTPEPYLSNAKDYVSKLEFELSKIQYPDQAPRFTSGDWESFTKELLKEEEFGGQLANPAFLKKIVAEAVAGKTDSLAKMKAVVEYVKNNMRWDGKHRIYTDNLRKAFDNRQGSSSEVNLLLTALLREAGVEANPMLVSTRDNGRPLENSPMISKFDYVIACASVGGKNYLLDATEKDLPFGMLPLRCLNGKGWVVQAPAGKWLPLTGVEKNMQMVSGRLKLQPTGEVTGTLTENFLGVPALRTRSAIRAKGQETYIKDFVNAGPDWVRQGVKIHNLDNLQESLKKEYELNRTGDGAAADLLYLAPMLTHGQGENPFKLTERQFPIDFSTPVDETYVFTYDLPQGYALEEMPQSASITLPGNAAKFTYVAQMVNGQLQVISKLNISKTFFEPSEYASLREFYSRMVAKHAEKIVLKKKS